MPDWFERTVIYPADDRDREAVRHLQRVFGLAETGEFDPVTRVRTRGFQALMGLKPTGHLDKATAEAVETVRSQYSAQ